MKWPIFLSSVMWNLNIVNHFGDSFTSAGFIFRFSVIVFIDVSFHCRSYISKRLRTKFDVLAESLMPSLIALLPNSARVMSSSAVVTITFIIAVSYFSYYRPRSTGDNTFGSFHVSICLWALSCLNSLTFDRDFWHEGWPWPWLAWDCRSSSQVKGQGQTVKLVYALPFEPVVTEQVDIRTRLAEFSQW